MFANIHLKNMPTHFKSTIQNILFVPSNINVLFRIKKKIFKFEFESINVFSNKTQHKIEFVK